MNEVAVKIKVMPKDISTDLIFLKKKIIDNLPNGSSIYGDSEIRPIAFGLNSLIITVLVKDDEGEGGIESVEQSIMMLQDIENIHILEVGRV